jgi:hypothetical protein
MSALPQDEGKSRKRTSLFLVSAAAILGLAVVLLANAHLVYVSVMSQPECVAHIKSGEKPVSGGSFSAATSSC